MTINITTITAINIGVVGEVVVEVVSRNECVENVSTSEFRLVEGNKVGATKDWDRDGSSAALLRVEQMTTHRY